MFISHPDHERLIATQAGNARAAQHRRPSPGTTGRRPPVIALVGFIVAATVGLTAFEWQRTAEAFAPHDDDEVLLRDKPPDRRELGNERPPHCADGWFKLAVDHGDDIRPRLQPVWVRFG